MSQPEENFTWIPFYRELARKLLDFRDDRTPLVKNAKDAKLFLC